MTRTIDQIRRSVIKILTQSDAPDFNQPWQTQGVDSSVGSGAIVRTAKGLRVLTNAHVIENHVFVEVRRYGKPKKFLAGVEGVAHACDLALLVVEDETFFTDAVPIEVGELPMLGDEVTVLGYPIGGDRLSITQGIVSRIEVTPYEQSQRPLLSVQIDAAINAGNSGGPVISPEGTLVGVAFQGLDEGQNIGYMIGAPVIQHFLDDAERGTFNGFPDLGIVAQALDSTAHRRLLALPKGQSGGVLVVSVAYGSTAWKQLKRGDVLLEVDGVRIASDGSVAFRRGERIDMAHIVTRRHVGEALPVKIWRDGKTSTLELPLKPPSCLVPGGHGEVKPRYFFYGGVLFVPLTMEYMRTWGDDWAAEAPAAMTAICDGGIPTAARREVVVLQKVLADQVNRGYHDYENTIVSRVQGRRIRDLRHLMHRVARTTEPFVRFDLDDGSTLVLDREKVDERNAKIMKRFGIPDDRSPDLR